MGIFFAIFMFHIKMTTLHRRDKVLVQLPPATIFPYIHVTHINVNRIGVIVCEFLNQNPSLSLHAFSFSK